MSFESEFKKYESLLIKAEKEPLYNPGQRVRFVPIEGNVEYGRVTAIYTVLHAAIETGCLSEDWYGNLTRRPKTAWDSGPWYSLLLDDAGGAVLVGEEDLKEWNQ